MSGQIDLPVEVVFEDGNIVVVAKPPGMTVHAGPSVKSATLVGALADRMELAGGDDPQRPGVVHRLDKDTSGLMVLAKTPVAYEGLIEAMQQRLVIRRYTALVSGRFNLPSGRIDAPMGRSRSERTRRAVVAGGKQAITEFEVKQEFAASSLLGVQIQTGRTHQIRVHMAHVHHPIVGDRVYGPQTLRLAASVGLQRPFLHAHELKLSHPTSGRALHFVQPLFSDLQQALEILEQGPQAAN